MHILGISAFYHDSAACLIQDGKIVAAAEEERFTRKKHDSSFPANAIDYCLKAGRITADQLDYVGFYEKPFLKFERILFSHIHTFPFSYRYFLRSMPEWLTKKLRTPRVIRRKLRYDGPILFCDHHESHAASAFFVSPFKKAAILTVDGVGEWATASYGIGEGTKIRLMKQMDFPNSLGLLYSMMTGFLGFKVNNDEYKVMGLASYGKPRYVNELKKIVEIHDDGSITLNLAYFDFLRKERMYSERFIEEFGEPRKPESELTTFHKDMSASLQQITEEIVVSMANHVHRETKMTNLCLAGGVALNVVANKLILERTPFKRIFVQPASSDAGGSLGVAYLIYNQLLGQPRTYQMTHAYHGPEFSGQEIKNFLEMHGVPYEEHAGGVERKTAKHIADNKIVGWFQGRMEWGPRALGNRSILANPCNPKMKDILNNKVKHREDFRPFAPAAPLERAAEFFHVKQADPFMTILVDVKEGKQRILPSVTHVDGTGRLQTVEEGENKKYYRVMTEFERYSGAPVVINTSFNVRGEPIVCTPEDAFRCFIHTGIDVLVMGNFIISKDKINLPLLQEKFRR